MTNVDQTMNYRPVQTFEKGMLRLKGKAQLRRNNMFQPCTSKRFTKSIRGNYSVCIESSLRTFTGFHGLAERIREQ